MRSRGSHWNIDSEVRLVSISQPRLLICAVLFALFAVAVRYASLSFEAPKVEAGGVGAEMTIGGDIDTGERPSSSPDARPTLSVGASKTAAPPATFTDGFDPPPVEEFIHQLGPPPTSEELLDWLASDPAGARIAGARDEDQAHIEVLEARIRQLRTQAEFTEAVPIAEELLRISVRVFGDNWKTVDARRQVRSLRAIVALPSEGRHELARVDSIDLDIENLFASEEIAEAISEAGERLTTRLRLLGERHYDVTTSLVELARLKQRKTDYRGARALYLRALMLRRELLGSNHPGVAEVLMHLSSLLRSMANHAQADSLGRSALSIFCQAYGEEHETVPAAMTVLGLNAQARGDYETARPLLRRALATRQRLFAGDHLDVAESVENLGSLLKLEAKYGAALSKTEEAFAMRRRLLGDRHTLVARSLNHLAQIRQAQGDYTAAELLFRESLAVHRHHLGDSHPATGRVVGNLGVLLAKRGDPSAAERCYRDALAIFRRAGDGFSTAVAWCQNNLAGVLRRQHRYPQAEEMLRNVLEVRRQVYGDTHYKVGVTLHNLAQVINSQRRYDEAEPVYLEALRIFRETLDDYHPYVAGSLLRLAQHHTWCGEYEDAERTFAEVIDILSTARGRDHPEVSGALAALAWMFSRKGDYVAAEPYFREALDIAEGLRARAIGQADERASYAAALGFVHVAESLGQVLIRLGRPDDAVDVFERGHARIALDILAQVDQDTEGRARSAGQEGQALDRPGSTTQPESPQNGSVEVVASESLRDAMPEAEPVTIEQIRNELDHNELLLMFNWTFGAISLVVVPPADRGVVKGVILAEGKEEVAKLAHTAKAVYEEITVPPSAGDARHACAQHRHELFNVLFPKWVRERVMSVGRVVVVPAGRTRSIPIEALVMDPPKESDDAVPPRLFLDEIPEVVYADSASVYLNRRRVRRAQLAAPGGGKITALLLGDPAFQETRPEITCPDHGVLIARVPAYSKAEAAGLRDGDVLLKYHGDMIADYDALVRAMDAVAREYDSAGQDERSMIAVEYWRDGVVRRAELPRGELDVQLSRQAPAEHWQIVAAAVRGPDHEAAQISALRETRLHGNSLAPLRGTRHEVKAVARMMNSVPGYQRGFVSILLGGDASIGRLEADVVGKRYVLLATHGLTGTVDRPYDASLALTQPAVPTPDDIGFLTLDRLLGRWQGKLESCELVVLSACESQHRVEARGEAIMSLPWGFMYAGAPSVVASLWKVDDRAAFLLMKRFFENLLGQHSNRRASFGPEQPMPKAEALREAKVWLRSLAPWEARERLQQAGFEVTPHLQVDDKRGERGGVGKVQVEFLSQEQVYDFSHPYYWAGFVLTGAAD